MCNVSKRRSSRRGIHRYVGFDQLCFPAMISNPQDASVGNFKHAGGISKLYIGLVSHKSENGSTFYKQEQFPPVRLREGRGLPVRLIKETLIINSL